MRILFTPDGQLSRYGIRLARYFVILYTLILVLMCFLPQQVYPQYKQFSTPGIIQIGRLYILPIPFNTFINSQQIASFSDFCLVLLQNVTNIFLLYPLVLPLIFLFEKWQNLKAVIRYSFYISLSIELTQLLLDLLIDAGRVFEVDDLWTNTLGGILAYCTYKLWIKWQRKNRLSK